MIRALGIDLAAQDAATASCLLEVAGGQLVARPPEVGRELAEIEAEMRSADWVGIDAPFGWPAALIDQLGSYAKDGSWSQEQELIERKASRLRHRETEREVNRLIREERGISLWPLSPSSSWIAIPSWRCASLLSRHAAATRWSFDRTGLKEQRGDAGYIVEVYPAGALAMWGMRHRGYKGRDGASRKQAREHREEMVEQLQEKLGKDADLSAARELAIESHDALDALVAALVALAANRQTTHTPDADPRYERIMREGWIHLPRKDCLPRLAAG